MSNLFIYNIPTMKEIKNQVFEEERSLYNLSDTAIDSCKFSGKTDGESPLKEAHDIKVVNSHFDLRYSFWHVTNCTVENTSFSNTARAPFWYSKNIKLNNVKSDAVKVFRECQNVLIENSTFNSEEPFWKCVNINVNKSKLAGFYAFFGSKAVTVSDVEFTGKYSFQYIKNLFIIDSKLDTKDAFWHCKDVVVANSTIKGEYIGWYSKNMTFINCTIESHQPFCYSKNLKFIDCKMPNCDLAFENSTVKGNIIGEIDSIKNPIKCDLVVDNVKEVIKDSPLHKIKLNLKKQ